MASPSSLAPPTFTETTAVDFIVALIMASILFYVGIFWQEIIRWIRGLVK